MSEVKIEVTPELEMLRNNRASGVDYRKRRMQDCTTTYDLYRDKVKTNRLTQRQSVHVPLMKYQIRTLIKDVDDMPVLYFENLDNDKEAEMVLNEYWQKVVTDNNMELQDIVDKRQVLLFGRSYDQWQIIDGKVVWTVQDFFDILVSRYVDPFNIDSSRFLIHLNIFEPLAVIAQNTDYDSKVVKELIKWHGTTEGIAKAAENEETFHDKMQKMADIGDTTALDPVTGETYVEINLHFVYRDKEESDEIDEDTGKKIVLDEQIFLYVVADNNFILRKIALEKLIGQTSDHYWRNHFPYESWADDLERQDWFSDGVGDIIRGPNLILDVWYSQMVEARTLRSLGMKFYDSTKNDNWKPQVWQPKAFGFYGVPGNPNELIQDIPIPDLSESIDEMQFVMGISDRASGATSTQQGVQTKSQITLGEVELALGEAKERVKGMSKFYTPAWERRGCKFLKFIEAAGESLAPATVHKKGKMTNNIYTREIGPSDWITPQGYNCKVWSQDEKEANDQEQLQKWNALKLNMPDNPKVDEIFKRKLTEFAGATPAETNEIMMFEEQKRMAMMSMIGQGVEVPGMPGDPAMQPQQQAPQQLMIGGPQQ